MGFNPGLKGLKYITLTLLKKLRCKFCGLKYGIKTRMTNVRPMQRHRRDECIAATHSQLNTTMYSCYTFLTQHYKELSGQLQVPAALLLGLSSDVY
jgi:hypothetical protein